MSVRPVIRLLPGQQKRARHGHPWIYSNEIVMDAATKKRVDALWAQLGLR